MSSAPGTLVRPDPTQRESSFHRVVCFFVFILQRNNSHQRKHHDEIPQWKLALSLLVSRNALSFVSNKTWLKDERTTTHYFITRQEKKLSQSNRYLCDFVILRNTPIGFHLICQPIGSFLVRRVVRNRAITVPKKRRTANSETHRELLTACKRRGREEHLSCEETLQSKPR